MLKYIKVPVDKPYVDLVVSYEKASAVDASEDSEEMGPPVRYYYNSWLAVVQTLVIGCAYYFLHFLYCTGYIPCWILWADV